MPLDIAGGCTALPTAILSQHDRTTTLNSADKVWLASAVRPLIHHGRDGQTFELAGGGRSDWYLDCRDLVYGVDAPLVAQIIDTELMSLYFDAVGGVGFGGTPLGILVAARRGVRSFAVRLDQKGHGRAGKVLGPLRAGDQVVLVEDVFTTGSSVCSAVEALRAAGIIVATVLCLVNRGNPHLRIIYGDIPFTALLTSADLEA